MTTYETEIKTMREGYTLAERLLKARQDPTDDEVNTIAAALDAADRVKLIQKQAEEDEKLRRELAEVLRDDLPQHDRYAGQVGLFSAKSAATGLVDKMSGSGRKALAPSGAEIAPAGLTQRRPIELGRIATSLLAVVPAEIVRTPPTYAYLKQTTRTNSAATVASGATKPTSAYGLTRVEDRLRVIAHLSEPIDKYWLQDLQDLRTFVDNELRYGLDLAVEQQLLNGDGIGENNRGVLNTPGIQSQTWSTDGYETLRKALTKLQQQGAGNGVVALNPVDFEAMTLLRATTNQFIATDANVTTHHGGGTAPPYGPTVLSSWGVPLVLTNALAAGQGVVFDPDAVRLYTDGNVEVLWDSSHGFTTNELIARCEGRFGVAVLKPLLVVSVDMTSP